MRASRWLQSLGARRREPRPARGTSFGWPFAVFGLRSRSVRGKLMSVVLVTTLMALLVAGLAMLTNDLGAYRRGLANDLDSEAGILALSTAPALAFDDYTAAKRNVDALQARSSVLAAAIYRPDGALYASFTRAGSRPVPARLGLAPEQRRIHGTLVELTRPVTRGGDFLGTIYLRGRLDLLGRMEAYAGIFALVTLLALAVALLLSTMLHRVVTAPLEAMTGVARQVVHGDYSARAHHSSDDELGLVVQAFNRMLDEVQQRASALEHSNAALQEQVREREAAEHALRQSEKLYRAIGESIEYGVWVCDAQGNQTYASESFLQLIGMTQEQCAGDGWAAALHPEEAKTDTIAWQQCVQTGGVWYREQRIRGRDGEYHPILAHGVPIRADDGRITGWAGIHLDISRLKHTEEALRESDRRKDEFLATLAHELRNPLAPVRHAVKLLETQSDERRQRWAREVIARQVQRMALLLDDLLDVARITRGRLQLKKDYAHLSTLVASAVETVRPLIDAKHHTLEVLLPAEPVMLEADPLRISQALSNLLMNAAKYTDPGGHIRLEAALDEQGLRVSVRDTGIGLAGGAIPRLFEMFSQVDSAIDRAEGGLGIGLALVKGLVSMHGGSVEVSSPGIGLGSTFTICLPASALAHEQRSDGDSGGSAPLPPGRCRVLIADDNADAADSLAMLLEISGHQVCVAHAGDDALELAMRERPEALILDIGMPGLTGYELARRIRQEAWGRRALLVAVTGWGQKDDKERAAAAGFDQHLTKPVDTDVIERLLAAFCEQRPHEVPPRTVDALHGSS